MAQLEHIEAIEKRLWNAADTLRANSNYASNEYFLPVMGLIFLRHAYSRFLAVKKDVEANLPTRGGKTRALTKEDFSQKSAIFLQPKAQFDHLVSLTDSDDRARAIIEAMESIEGDYANLRGVLPRSEYQELENSVLGQLLRTLNPDELRHVSGDVFGRIYEYFLTQFADQKAHDGGEFFTPVSLVSLIANILEPEGGTVLDPACGSGGMFVQSARFVERRHENPVDRLTFYGLEKNATTIRLAKMNLAVHGLEGDIQRVITYYEDPHELLGKADFVMANPPFNVDEIDADRVKRDPRLPFGLPGVNQKGKVSNGNYVWISYFYSYLNERGRAGFVMSSQASSAGHAEAGVRQKLIETGDVEIMVAIRSNFFYTRSVPCELWFLNRDKPEEYRDAVLMIDARNIYRKVTRKIYDFSPEQEQNLLAIVWLYRGQTEKYLNLVAGYCRRMLDEGEGCFTARDDDGEEIEPLPSFITSLDALREAVGPFLSTLPGDAPHAGALKELEDAMPVFKGDVERFQKAVSRQRTAWQGQKTTNGELKKAVDRLAPLAGCSRDLIKQSDLLYKLACRLIETCENECNARDSDAWVGRELARARKAADEARQVAVEQLKQVRYFWRQAHWLTERFPEAKLCDVAGLVRLVDRAEIEANDWSLTPGRYVGVAPEEEDENFDFEEALREIHVELEDLNTEAVRLAATIKKNFEELEI
ncbi:MAG: N-6 DNA methylase [Methanoculleus sp.]|uniref:class I SAM-dependent DNA methyltransferase n=2 Tax=Methanoculleus sp. TaxID=90427 RepID=UPI0025D0A5EA|nr:N-6 DNA methylase [Methanoculleus sp.]MCK9318208.1 type I restriction-modification system subunit M [Methanoculleus sp.]MDD2255207.1 N-6 DNA methylase [Methanoculleus sp.]MDD3216273.1 N-6 DNA methylase [Methanoculleus sp.]MDD4314162.1 N-6 DNA methylase [Methanoculleus sp.]MDD4469634.1 N-6 DNA methylase [Methanoculleus sp.]